MNISSKASITLLPISVIFFDKMTHVDEICLPQVINSSRINFSASETSSDGLVQAVCLLLCQPVGHLFSRDVFSPLLHQTV